VRGPTNLPLRAGTRLQCEPWGLSPGPEGGPAVNTTQKVRFRDLTPEHVLVLSDKV
jgi:hypothetical protein